MGIRGRFKGFRTEATVAKMTAEEQKIYRDFVKEVENAQRNNLPLPEPPKFSTDKPDKPVNTTGKRRGRKPGSKKINGRMVSAEEYEKIKNGIVNDAVDKATTHNKAENDDAEDTEDTMDDADDGEDIGLSKREQLVAEIVKSHSEYQKEHILNTNEDKPWFTTNDSKGDVQETYISHISREGFCTIETNEIFWIRRIKKMIEKCPDKVIVDENFTNGDMLRVKIPYAAMKKVMVSTRTMSEEERQRMSEMGKSRRKKETEENTQESIPTPETTPTEAPIETPTENPTEPPAADTPSTDKEEKIEHVEAEVVSSPQGHFYEVKDEEEGEEGDGEDGGDEGDELEYEPASLNRGYIAKDDNDEVVFERPFRSTDDFFRYLAGR